MSIGAFTGIGYFAIAIGPLLPASPSVIGYYAIAVCHLFVAVH